MNYNNQDSFEYLLYIFNDPHMACDEIDGYQEYCSMLGDSLFNDDRIKIIRAFSEKMDLNITDKQLVKIDLELGKLIKF